MHQLVSSEQKLWALKDSSLVTVQYSVVVVYLSLERLCSVPAAIFCISALMVDPMA